MLIPPHLRSHLKNLCKELWNFDRRTLILALGTSLLSGLLAGGTLILLVPLLTAAGVESTGAMDQFGHIVKGLFSLAGLDPSVELVLIFWLLVTGANLVLWRVAFLVHADFTIRFLISLRKSYYHALAGADWGYLTEQRNWALLHSATEDIYRVGAAVGAMLHAWGRFLNLLIYLGISLYISLKVTVVACITGLTVILILWRYVRKTYGAGEEFTTAARSLFGDLGGFLEGFKVARCYGLDQAYIERFDNSLDAIADIQYRQATYTIDAKIGFAAGNALVIAFLAYYTLTMSGLSTGPLLLLIYVFSKMMPQFGALQQTAQRVATSVPGYRSFAVFRQRCLEAEQPVPERNLPLEFKEEIVCRDLGYYYEGGTDEAGIGQVSLSLRRGKTVALIGRSGSGKTTLADLMVGLLTPARGEVCIDGQPLDASRLQGWRQRISYVSQDPFFFNDTIEANLKWAKPDATEEELWRALELVGARELVEALEAKLETPLGERGNRLSRGERQRIAVARALLRKPIFLVLDEATGSLDVESERALLEALRVTAAERVTLVVSHRASVLNFADEVIMMEAGTIKQTGSPEEFRDSSLLSG